MFQIRFANLVRHVFIRYKIWLLLLVAGLVGCQQLPGAVGPKTDSSNISWKGLTVQRDDLPTSKEPDENIEAGSVDINEAVSAVIPEAELPMITVAPQGIDPQLFLEQSPAQLKSRLGAPTTLRKEGQVNIWQYQLPECVIDFYFYEKAGTMVATHTDMRSLFLGGALDEAACKLALFKIDQAPDGAQ